MKSHRVQKKSPTTPPAFWGHQPLQDRLVTSLTAQTLPPVLLFVGPNGVGKERGATWLMQFDRCHETNRPCGVCQECRHIINQNHTDVVELTGKPDAPISIEVIRTALRNFQHRPTISDRSRWLLIQQADWISPAGVSALLKFLEEPPPLMRVILTAEHPAVLPLTIRSRAAVYRWHLVPDQTWTDLPLEHGIRARAAGRPDWIQSASEDERLRLDEILAFLSGQPLPGAWLKLDVMESRSLLDTLELVGRDILLSVSGASQRLLWPGQADQYTKIAQRLSASQIATWLDRLGERARQLRRHVPAKYLLQDTLLYV